jgi:hypothetical protein
LKSEQILKINKLLGGSSNRLHALVPFFIFFERRKKKEEKKTICLEAADMGLAVERAPDPRTPLTLCFLQGRHPPSIKLVIPANESPFLTDQSIRPGWK